MDTNMAQALKLAGGLLIALVLISAVVYMFRALAPTQIALDDVKEFEQTAEFNKEFEVYNKDIMYGLDVISVINKAASYNKTYIDAYGYTGDLKDNYLVDIVLNNSVTLEQNIELYRINNIARQEIINCGDIHNTVDRDAICNKLEINSTDFQDSVTTILPSGVLIDSARNDDSLGNGKYVRKQIYDLIIEPSSEQIKRTIINNTNPEIWSKAILETYVYSFKSKKFRCTGTTYSDITGRITSLTFSEI